MVVLSIEPAEQSAVMLPEVSDAIKRQIEHLQFSIKVQRKRLERFEKIWR